MSFSVGFASLGNRAEAGTLPLRSPNAGFHFVELHSSIYFSGSKVQWGRAPVERRVRAARADNRVFALENSTCLFACIPTAAAEASHRERAWQGKRLYRTGSHQELHKQEPEKKFCSLKGNCYTVLDRVCCTNLWNQEGNRIQLSEENVQMQNESSALWCCVTGEGQKDTQNAELGKGKEKLDLLWGESQCASSKGISHVQAHFQGKN